jgi:transcriptional regulator with XRE-family HTH domain
MDICLVIGKNVRDLRIAQKLSQEELAYRAKMDRPYLSQIENGQRNLSVLMLQEIASALDVKVSALVKED